MKACDLLHIKAELKASKGWIRPRGMEPRRNVETATPVAAKTGLAVCPRRPVGHSSLRSQLFEEPTDRFNPVMEVRKVKLLVRSVQVVIGKAEAHHHAGNF